MRAANPGGEVSVVTFPSILDETAQLAGEIESLIQKRVVQAEDIAILARSAFRVTPLLAELRRRSVPVTNWLAGTYEGPERAILRACLPVVRASLTKRQADKLTEFLGVPKSEERNPALILESNADLPQAVALSEARRLAWAGSSVASVVAPILDATRHVRPADVRAVESLIASVAAFEAADPDFSLEQLVAEVTLGGVGGPPTLGGGVKVASLHRTKGLQWKRVYLLGLEEGRLPEYRATTAAAIRDERRACFVGVCRAEESLILTYTRTGSAGHINEPSRFLREMQVV
jgi:superfamily I DNA/RNA helicase